MRLSLSFGAALIGCSFLAAPATVSALPLTGTFSKELLSHSADNLPVIQVQQRGNRGGGGGRVGGGGGGRVGGGGGGVDAGAAAAAGIIGLAVGAIIASEAARQQEAQQGVQQGVEYCMRRFRSYNPETGIWVDRQGRQHQCP